jgi:hypothetical protein
MFVPPLCLSAQYLEKRTDSLRSFISFPLSFLLAFLICPFPILYFAYFFSLSSLLRSSSFHLQYSAEFTDCKFEVVTNQKWMRP